MKKRLILTIVVALPLVSCFPSRLKAYKFGEWDNGIMVDFSPNNYKFDVLLNNNSTEFSFGYLRLADKDAHRFDSPDLTFVDSKNEKIVFDESGTYSFENSFEERTISVYYSERIYEDIVLNDSYIRLEVCGRYYVGHRSDVN